MNDLASNGSLSEYRAPLADIRGLVQELSRLGQAERLPIFTELDSDLVEVVLDEAARWAEAVLDPLYRLGDCEPPVLLDGQVKVPEPIKSAYAQFVEGGWGSLAFEEEWGGSGLPQLISVAVSEIWKSANLGVSLCPMLTQAAARTLREHGTDDLKARFLRKLVRGEWTGTMNLTEPQAGSDLAALLTRAEPEGDHYRLRGRKILITWGDHDLTENIVHLVLARTPSAPPGVKGISLFLVPKFLVESDGSVGERNDVLTVSLEEKLGIHASPTCALSYGEGPGAVGFLLGEENRGLACMFTMMNPARLAVGVEGLAVAERAYQKASRYAQQRVQGRAPGRSQPTVIFHHPDVRRMLMIMRASTEAMRALAYWVAFELDLAHGSPDPERLEAAESRAMLLTPIVKGWCTELAQEITSLGLQIHGGMGYIEETGAAQIFRDARITSIYEGTTGIQANDLVGRKLIGDDGATLRALLAEVAALDPLLAGLGAPVKTIRSGLQRATRRAEEAMEYLLLHHGEDENLAGAVSVNFLLLLGLLLGGWQLARSAQAATAGLQQDGSAGKVFSQAKLATARFYAEHLLPRTAALHGSIMTGSASIMALEEERFPS